MVDLTFFKGKKILITGHTGFKGTWLSKILINAGANVFGYALAPYTKTNLFETIGIEKRMNSIIGDIRDLDKLKSVFEEVKPEIVFHLAAQPIVRSSYENPVYTYETNVMGTVNVLECIRNSNSVKSFLNVTTDKVYKNNEWERGYKEDDYLDGYDPYSNSKSCSELVTHSYKASFFSDNKVKISTARAGNVIGGGDFSTDRIIPDCVRAAVSKEIIDVRNPNAIRPYQHVLEPLFAYLMIAQKQFEDEKYAGYYNVGPDECDCITTAELVNYFCKFWKEESNWQGKENEGPHEACFLKLDCSKIKETFGWKPIWHIDKTIYKTVELYKSIINNQNVEESMNKQIEEYTNDFLRK